MGNVELRNRPAVSQIERILHNRKVIDDNVENVGSVVDGLRPGIGDLELMIPREAFVQLDGQAVIVGAPGSFDQLYCIEPWIDSVAASRCRCVSSVEDGSELRYARDLVG